ncbi:MAG TPA: undecaprenyl-diphosphate phosphatase [Elusimicrobiota bacterium]|nr:undecaprenyl-diphosphate phosphatase [Elusimicrobiota bacterium]
MRLSHTAALGVVQGLTEFLPISSDGHLSLLQILWKMGPGMLTLDIWLHVGTLFSILVYFRNDWLALWNALSRGDSPEGMWTRRDIVLIVVANVPTALIGLLLKGSVDSAVTSMAAVGLGFLVTAVFLSWGQRRLSMGPGALPRTPFWHAALIGVVQGLAVWPGWSRSGTTIATALLLGWSGERAARFSFIIAVPAIMGATLLNALDTSLQIDGATGLGMAVSFGVGCLALSILMRSLSLKKLWPFALYCFCLSAVSFWFSIP